MRLRTGDFAGLCMLGRTSWPPRSNPSVYLSFGQRVGEQLEALWNMSYFKRTCHELHESWHIRCGFLLCRNLKHWDVSTKQYRPVWIPHLGLQSAVELVLTESSGKCMKIRFLGVTSHSLKQLCSGSILHGEPKWKQWTGVPVSVPFMPLSHKHLFSTYSVSDIL